MSFVPGSSSNFQSTSSWITKYHGSWQCLAAYLAASATLWLPEVPLAGIRPWGWFAKYFPPKSYLKLSQHEATVFKAGRGEEEVPVPLVGCLSMHLTF